MYVQTATAPTPSLTGAGPRDVGASSRGSPSTKASAGRTPARSSRRPSACASKGTSSTLRPRSSNRPIQIGRFNRPIQRSVRWIFGRFIFGRFVGLNRPKNQTNRPIQKRTDRFPQEPTDCFFNLFLLAVKSSNIYVRVYVFYVVPVQKQLKSACAGKQPMVKRSAIINKKQHNFRQFTKPQVSNLEGNNRDNGRERGRERERERERERGR